MKAVGVTSQFISMRALIGGLSVAAGPRGAACAGRRGAAAPAASELHVQPSSAPTTKGGANRRRSI